MLSMKSPIWRNAFTWGHQYHINHENCVTKQFCYQPDASNQILWGVQAAAKIVNTTPFYVVSNKYIKHLSFSLGLLYK